MKKLIYITPILLALGACKPEIPEQNISMGEVDASRFLAVGNGYIQGFMDDALTKEGQENSVPNILVKQFNLINEVPFEQYLVNESSVGISLNGDARLIMGYKTDCTGETALSPVRAAASGDASILSGSIYNSSNPIQNYGIANGDISFFVSAMFGPTNPFIDRISADPYNKSLKEDMDNYNPTSYVYALGEAQLINYALQGGDFGASILPATGGSGGNDFQGFSQTILSALENSATSGVICTVPDVTEYPFFTTIPWNYLELDAANATTLNQLYQPFNSDMFFQAGYNGFVIEDTAAPYDVRQIQEGELITLRIPLDSVKCHGMGTIIPIPQEYILDSLEIQNLRVQQDLYNQVISDLAVQYDIALADINGLYTNIQAGLIYNGISTNTEFVTGGFFSLDGRNPSPKGNAFIANEIIKALNNKYNAKIPYCDPGDYHSVKFP